MLEMTLANVPTTSSDQNLEKIITQLALTTLAKKPEKIKPDDPLLSTQAGFDSFSLMEFVFRLEEAFDLHIPDSDLDPDVFYSVATVASYIRARLQAA